LLVLARMTPTTDHVETDPYDTTEAVQLLITDRAKRYSHDFVEAREVAAVALRDAVMRSAKQAGYFTAEGNGRYEIAPREGTSAVVVLLANPDGIRVARLEAGKLSDETTADLRYDASRKAWVTSARNAGSKESTKPEAATDPRDPKEPGAPKAATPQTPVAVVAALVVGALQKIT
jgi:hypothetical protein